MKYKTVIFDIDGTLLNTEKGVTRALSYTLERFGKHIPPDFDKRRFLAPSMGYTMHNFFGFTPEQADAALAVYRIRYAEDGFSDTELFPGIYELLTDLHAAGVKIVIATSRNGFSTFSILDRYRLNGFVSHAAFSDGDPRCNSKRAIIKDALSAAELPAIMVGDTVLDADGARENGVPFIGMLYGYGIPDELESAGAYKLCKSAGELREILL
ncbi:MAG: HAD hydrolase-like protein [Clostridiales bacterium]|jgi:phosphoglycolate phosphatase|nr:HAD hydrolase-like protein [Clostridiales bacterium]